MEGSPAQRQVQADLDLQITPIEKIRLPLTALEVKVNNYILETDVLFPTT